MSLLTPLHPRIVQPLHLDESEPVRVLQAGPRPQSHEGGYYRVRPHGPVESEVFHLVGEYLDGDDGRGVAESEGYGHGDPPVDNYSSPNLLVEKTMIILPDIRRVDLTSNHHYNAQKHGVATLND